jgi:hypothetical protein
MYTNNETLYLHYLMETPNIYESSINFTANPQFQMRKNFRNSVPIVKYMKQIKEGETVNLMAELTSDIP